MERPSEQRRRTERRRLFDRRSPLNRRVRQDRRRNRAGVEAHAAPVRAWTGMDRRRAERRQLSDRRQPAARRLHARRRDTPTPFTYEQVAQLREQFQGPGPVTCPACGGSFALGLPRVRGGEVARQVRCLSCGRGAIVTNTRVARILVIEQKEVIRDTLRAIFLGAGHDVVEAADAGVGLAAYQASPPDVVFLDVHASGRMEAAEFMRRLRKEHPEARVVAMSGRPSYGALDPLVITHGLGAVRTIRMPFSRDDVLRVVEEARH
jgi:CheY-like chemotaxis protein